MNAGLKFDESQLHVLHARNQHGKLFSCQSARARVWRNSEHGWSAAYSGVLTQLCFSYLRARVISEMQGAKVMTLDVSHALLATLGVPPIPSGTYNINHTPGAVVVREDQYGVWREYARQMAELGIIRVVFLKSQWPQAQRWVQRLALDPS